MNKIKYISLLWKHNAVTNTISCKPYSNKLTKRLFINGNNKYFNKRKNIKVKCYKCHRDINVDNVPFSCQSCKALINVDVFKIFNFFELFGFRKVSYDLDKNYLKKKFNDIQKIYHPDKNAQNSELERINEVSSYLNNAYGILLNDIDRASYMINIQYNYKIPEDENLEDEEFLSEIIKINEEINKPEMDLLLLTREYKDKYEDHVKKIKLHFEEKDFENILNTLKKLKFINKILERLKNL
ncbi:chaperone, putative [Plasmodium malariae]|uniref:Chaperone, putative n=1 Tax=Plasmodium malariae TaxID=5858 RepID=A0A1C3KBM4_PLAMA|nr:chaperone, putative [Plasmodium malariae]